VASTALTTMAAPRQDTFSFSDRRRWLEEAASGIVDVLVIGGGITGAGVAREAALRGLSVLLLDQGDFASGTSSRSSKLIHGGIRYLAQGDIALVREAARERSILRAIAPHLARPLRMLIPAPSLAGRLKLVAGLWTFEKLAGDVDDARHEILSSASVAKLEPGLRPAVILGGAVAFTEYATNDARLTLETLKAAARSGAHVANYAQVIAIRGEQKGGVRATVRDLADEGELEVRARCIVNAAGPWFDVVNELVESTTPRATQLTRGIHIVVPHDSLPVTHLVVLRAEDGRSCFVVPNGPVVYIGTTDTLFEGSPGEPGVSQEDVRYLLDSVSSTFATTLRTSEIIGTWSGVRPLLRADGKKPSEISRRDEIRVGPGPIVAIVGGKLTTYRRMAERVVQAVLGVLGRQDCPGAGESARRPLVGGSIADQSRLRATTAKVVEPELEERLWATYGVAAAQILDEIRTSPATGVAIDGFDELCAAEIDYAVRYEMAIELDDVLRRRSRAGMFRTAEACAAAASVAKIMARLRGWDEERSARGVETFRRERMRELRSARGDPLEGTAE
jgi:glycerol-3-phosphate dehydrogenase